jgi:hypothetical protein
LDNNQLTGTIPSTVRALSVWYVLPFRIDRLSLRLQQFPVDVLGERTFVVAPSILT